MNEIEKSRYIEKNQQNQSWFIIFKNNTFCQNCSRKKLRISNIQEQHIDTTTNITREK